MEKEIKEDVKLDKETTKKAAKKKETPKKKPKKIKPYVHIDTFLKTAVPLFELTNMQAQGFKSRMKGRQYQRDEQILLMSLKNT